MNPNAFSAFPQKQTEPQWKTPPRQTEVAKEAESPLHSTHINSPATATHLAAPNPTPKQAEEEEKTFEHTPPTFVPTPLESLEASGLMLQMIEDLLFKWLLNKGVLSGRELAKELCLPFQLLEPLFLELKQRLLLSFKQTTGVGDFLYVLSDTGRERALRAREVSAYVGPAPVPFDAYLKAVHAQSIRNEHPNRADLDRAFSDLVLSDSMFATLGPAIHSGRGLFLYGSPGNGKTSIAERICKCFHGYVFVPKAIWVDGQIIQLYDPENHKPVSQLAKPPVVPPYDSRWIAIERPVIIVGGELTMEALEICYNPDLKISEAPLQMKANNGVFMIDDFGRQRIHPQELLNRWIVPLEKKIDYLSLQSGKKLQVPFDELILFSTNLDPAALVDEAFLRRLPYKIHVDSPDEPTFRRLFKMMASKGGVVCEEAHLDYLIATHYTAKNRPFRACQARDLMDQVLNMCRYQEVAPHLSPDKLDQACANYFSIMV
jgi:hypothetical protein